MSRPPRRARLGAPASDGRAARGAADPLLRVEDVRKAFGGITAVDGATFGVRRGTITGLIGPNGAGKTTLFNLITGFIAPDAGRVVFRGEDITGRRPHRVFRAGLCRTFQIPREFRELTVLENLMVVPEDQLGERLWTPWLRPRAVRAEESAIRDRALSVLEFLKLAHLAQEDAASLSGGQKKLLELARVLMGDPDMLLLDEPGAGVNPTLMNELAGAIERLVAERAVTVLLIEHDMDLVMGLCNPIVVMSEGRTLAEGTPAEIRRDARVLEAYLGARAGRASA
jgi:branched-chain amino acid transport system ATP-binding protein